MVTVTPPWLTVTSGGVSSATNDSSSARTPLAAPAAWGLDGAFGVQAGIYGLGLVVLLFLLHLFHGRYSRRRL